MPLNPHLEDVGTMPDVQDPDKERRSLRSFLEMGSEIGGSVFGAAIGLMVEGPSGAVAAAVGAPVASRMLRDGALEFMDRTLSYRERMRVASVVALAAERIDKKLKQGFEPRHDGFFDGEPGNRSAAEEIAEGVLIAGQREHEEKKLPYLANLLANIAFHAEIDRAYANLLVSLSEQLSYRQLCLLALFKDKDRYSLRRDDYRATSTFSIRLVAVLQEVTDLESRGLLNASGVAILDLAGVNPAEMDVQGVGIDVCTLMELWQIEENELRSLAVLMA